MRAARHNFSTIKNQDLVGVPDGRDALRDNKNSGTANIGGEVVADGGVGRVVEGAERVIKNVQVCSLVKGSRHGEALSLAPGKVPPTGIYPRVEPVLEQRDKLCGLRAFEGTFNLGALLG